MRLLEQFSYRLGEMRDRSFESQVYLASGLNLLIAAIILWNARYPQAAFVKLQQQGVNVTPTIVTHVAPLGWEHIGFQAIMSGLTQGSLPTVFFDRSDGESRCSRPEYFPLFARTGQF